MAKFIELTQHMQIDKEKIKEIDKRIESQHKEYLSKLRDANREAKDFKMNN